MDFAEAELRGLELPKERLRRDIRDDSSDSSDRFKWKKQLRMLTYVELFPKASSMLGFSATSFLCQAL